MLKRNLRVITYLLLSLSLGVIVTLITTNLENRAEEKRFKKAVEHEVRSAVASFKYSAPNAAPDDVVRFLKEFTASAMRDKVVAVERGEDKKPVQDEFKHLFRFSEGKKRVDIYINELYVQEEISSVDLPDFIPGFFTTVVVFASIIFYTEKKQRTLAMQQELQIKHAELTKAMQENEALALLGRMTATLAHELKTPIATISNLLQILPSRFPDEAFTRRFVTLTKEELKRTQQLIDNLLIYGKDLALTKEEWIEVPRFIRDLALKNNIKLASCQEFSVNGDNFYMRLLFENLMRNSVQAGATESSIKIKMPRSGYDPDTEVFYEDNGPGFPEDCDLNELLNPFVTRRSKGAGLGLYLVQKIAVAHEGSVSLYRPGSGAGVKITLPKKRIRVHEHAAV